MRNIIGRVMLLFTLILLLSRAEMEGGRAGRGHAPPPQFLERKKIIRLKNQKILKRSIFLAYYPSQQYKRNENSKQRLIPEKMKKK
jgi:hypothetical protein